LIVGTTAGAICMSLCVVAGKESEYERTYHQKTSNEFLKPMDDIKLLNFKETLKIILNSDIKLYERLYKKSNNVYYSGRIQECKFLLRIIEGKVDDETRKCEF
jgi:hypothetical protein